MSHVIIDSDEISLLLATHLLRTAMSAHLLLVLPLHSALRIRVQVAIMQVLQDSILAVLAVPVSLYWLASKDFSDLLEIDWRDRIFLGVGDQELDVEMAVGHGVLVEGHSESLDSLEFAVIDHFSGRSGNDVLFAIQMLHPHCDASECLKQSDLLDQNQISSSALESVMFLDLDANIDISSNDARLNKGKNTYSSFYPVKMQSCQLGQPVQIATSSTRSTLTTFLPLQLGHLSSSFMVSPIPPQSPHLPCDCEYIPGPNCTILVTTPVPLHLVHLTTFLPPLPSQGSQIRSLLIFMFLIAPWQISSRVTYSSISLALPLRGPEGLRPPPPPKKSNSPPKPDPPGGPPFLTPSSPQSSQSCLFSGLDKTSQAEVTSLNFSGSPPLSGCSFSAFLRKALRISYVVAFLSTPSSSQYRVVLTSSFCC